MVNDVVDLTLTKPRTRRRFIKRWRTWRMSLAVVSLMLAGWLLWPATPRDLGVGKRLLTAHLLPAWREGELIVLVRHEERCDRSKNPCLGPSDGLTVVGHQHAEALGKAFNVLGMTRTDVLASPATRTAQTAHAMFGNVQLTADPQAICGEAIGEQLLQHKHPGRNLIFVTHSGCIADFEKALGYPHAAFPQYGSALFIRARADGRFDTLGLVNGPAWTAVLKNL
ncbi:MULTISPECIES: histidine phosphatase family protein [Pseudomonas]|jgi:phosphohistidine phosphatase SixA|uniref:lipopolysaccharide core heptose(II)-phosphate phosphatase PmrG n=1 Tax=Pseudomonas TaxID=286 RepID=UPI001AEB4337|nr:MULTISPECIES: histidine phosphatase family protein [unclassified Pseudomonas]